VVRQGQAKTEQPQDGADQTLGLAQRQAEHGTESQSRRGRQAGVRLDSSVKTQRPPTTRLLRLGASFNAAPTPAPPRDRAGS
jgi:hypothetical protein